jgi:hypothetical protein
MEIIFKESATGCTAIIRMEGPFIFETQDALDLMAECSYRGATGILLKAGHLDKKFFDLKTGLAGDILQKFSNYQMKLAIAGEFSNISSKSLRDFIRESNRQGQVCFVESEEEGLRVLEL